MNLWMLLLAGLAMFMGSVVIPLFGGPENYHYAMGLGSSMGSGLYVVIELVSVTFGMFDLTLILFALGFSGTIWIIGAAIKIYMLIKKAIPFV